MMADRSLHFGFGMVLGVLVVVPRLVRSWRSGEMVSRDLSRLLVVSCGLGVLAIVPNLLHKAGCSITFCSGWWMNVFVGHHLLGKLKPGGGALIGQILITACFSMQYVLVFAALIRQRYINLGYSRASGV